MGQKNIYEKKIKRFLDIVLSMAALTGLSPVLIVTAILVRCRLGSPVVFKQARPGYKEKIFYLYKFRSMTNETGEDGRLLPDAQRLTKFGKFLRSSSIDELLELFNILKGDMSFVGPRPLSMYYLPHYPKRFRGRHNVRPGLTGLAQVNGRNNLPWDDRFAMDMDYVGNVSFRNDFLIILETALKVLRRSDVSVRGTAKVGDYGPYCILKEEKDGGKKVAGMTYSEIGSYFWLDGSEKQKKESEDREQSVEQQGQDGKIRWLPRMQDTCFTFSGRNAIDTVLRDIRKHHSIDRVYVPSYCCVSMLQAFIDQDIKVDFYRTLFVDGRFTWELPPANDHSIVLIMSYFGLSTGAVQKAVRNMKEKGAVVIEDITHSLLHAQPFSGQSDYAVASLRKWFSVPTGGWAGKRDGTLAEKPSLESNHAVAEKIGGMEQKYAYLTGKIDSKEDFLLTQAKFDNDLIHVDRMLKIDDTSMRILEGVDIDSVIERRRKNVRVLIQGLQDLDGKVLELPETDLSRDTPLFLPVFLNTEERDSLRTYLIGRGIYCPVHWPEVMGAPAGIRERELSLICDQRYNEGDMQAIVNAVHDWNNGRMT